jgi:hypothetical protein
MWQTCQNIHYIHKNISFLLLIDEFCNNCIQLADDHVELSIIIFAHIFLFTGTSLWIQGFMFVNQVLYCINPIFIPFCFWLFLEMGSYKLCVLTQKHWNRKRGKSLRKEMNSSMVGQLPNFGDHHQHRKKLNKMILTKKKWTKWIQLLINPIRI